MELSEAMNERLETALARYQELAGPFQEAKKAYWGALYAARLELVRHPDTEYVMVDNAVHVKGAECCRMPVFEEFVDGKDVLAMDRALARGVSLFALGVELCGECEAGHQLAKETKL